MADQSFDSVAMSTQDKVNINQRPPVEQHQMQQNSAIAGVQSNPFAHGRAATQAFQQTPDAQS